MLSNHPVVDWIERDEMLEAISYGIRVDPFTDSPDGFSRHDFRWDEEDVFFRMAPVSTPWAWSEPVDTGKPGYVGGIIDAFTSLTSTYTQEHWINALSLWFTTSVWHGDLSPQHAEGLPGAYGVYTTGTTQYWSSLPE